MKLGIVGTVGLSVALTALGASPALAQQAAASPPRMDRETAEAVQKRNQAAWIALTSGFVLGGALASTGSMIITSHKEECNKLPEEAYAEQAGCIREAADLGRPWIYAGGASIAVGVLAFFVVRPGAAAREESERVLSMPDVRVHVDPKSRAGFATARFAF